MIRPGEINKPNTENLKEACEEYIDYLSGDPHEDGQDSFRHKIFENALESIYGKDVWEYVNSRIE